MRRKSLFLLSFLLLFNLHNVKAATIDNIQSNMSLPFGITPELPFEQVSATKGYFNLNVKPNQHQQLFVDVKNQTSHPINIEIASANALTSISGGIIYQSERGNKLTALMDNSFYMDQYVKTPKEVSLTAYETKKIPIMINAPNMNAGTILGGLLFTLKDTGETTHQSKDKKIEFTLKNKLAFCMAIQLNYPKTDVRPLKINNIQNLIFPSGSNIAFELENPSASIKRDVSYQYQVVDENGNQLFKGSIPAFNIAPKSRVNIPISWNANQYKNGPYTLILKPSYESNVINKDFKITNDDVKQYTKVTGHKPVIPVLDIPFYYWFIIILLIVVLVLGAYYLGRKKTEVPSRREVA